MLKACVKFNFEYDVWNLPTKLKKKRRVPLVAFSIQRQKNCQLWPIIGHYSVSLSVYKDQKTPIKKGWVAVSHGQKTKVGIQDVRLTTTRLSF